MRALLLLLVAGLHVTAQTYDLARQGDVVGDLSKAKWRFHTGDDPRWATTNVDDSGWSLLSGDKPWDEQGYKQYSGFAWYRLRVAVPNPNIKLRIRVANARDAVEVFANSVQIGRFGSLSPEATPILPGVPQLVTSEFAPTGHQIMIAVRVWHWPKWAVFRPGGIAGEFTMGPTAAIQHFSSLQEEAFLLTGTPGLCIGLIALIAAICSLLLFWRAPSATEYLWLALNLICGPVFGEFTGFFEVMVIETSVPQALVIGEVIGFLARCSTILFLSRFLRRPVGKLTRTYLIAQIPVLLMMVYIAYRLPVSMPVANSFATVNATVSSAIVLYLVCRDIRRSREARIVALPMAIFSGLAIVSGVAGILYAAGLTTWLVPALLEKPVALGYDELAALLFLGGIAYLLTNRFADSRSEQTRLRTEFEAAQQVQQLLLQQPPASNELPIEVAYLPANEVGGDFFKVFPQSGGSVLVVVGDVSGKGLKAAMLVAGIIGALELITAETSLPGEILRRLNEFRVNKSSGGFVTCACARILPNGEVTLASAGHLPPYLDAKELEMESSLPLGIASGLHFSERLYRMHAGSRLAFMTDGVVEATNRSGELFGFDRTRDVAAEAPERIAEKARAFGQTDDITVLQIRMAAAATV